MAGFNMETRQTSFEDLPNVKRGRVAENWIAQWLIRRGWYVLFSYLYDNKEGKAPRLHGALKKLVIPDLDVSKCGQRIWVEMKWKEQATYTRSIGTWEHGINLRHYKDYLKVEEVTGCPVYLCVTEGSGTFLLHARLSALGPGRIYNGQKMDRSGMIFWPVDRFARIENWRGRHDP